MIHPFSGNCTWRRGMGEGWTLASAFWGSGQLCPCRLWAHPAHGAVLGCPQKLLCHPPLLHPRLGTLSPFCFWRTHLRVLSPLQAGGAPGGWGHKVSHHHHHLHQCITPKAEDWPPILLTACSLVISRSPSFWDGSHATVCRSPLFLLWKYQFSFVTQLPQSSFGHSAASGCQWVPFPPARSCKGRQPLSVPCEDVLFDKRWCDGQEWNCSPQSLWEKGLLGSSCISHHKSNGKQKEIHPKPSEGTN